LDRNNNRLSIRRQCVLLGVSRSGYYYRPRGISLEDQLILNELDRIYTKWPYYGSRRMSKELCRRGYRAGRKRVRRLMRVLGVRAIYPKKRLSIPNKEHKVYPYLIKGVNVDRSGKVWAADITYIKLSHGFVYLVAIIDWYSRYVLS
jgi:putative transposase